MTVTEFLRQNNIVDLDGLVAIMEERGKEIPVEIVYQAAEFLNPNRDTTAAFYTDTSICQYIMDELPSFADKECITILEPSVGAGNFIRFIAEKYKDKKRVALYLVDVDNRQLQIAERIYERYFREKYPNVSLVYINGDYLKLSLSDQKFDLVIGNPPYASVKDASLVKEYRKKSVIKKSDNLFVWFLEKAMRDGSWVSLVIPKAVLNAPEYLEIRNLIGEKKIVSVLDFGEYGFKGVKIETVNLLLTETAPPSNTHVYSVAQKIDRIQKQTYITDGKYPVWLLYRNEAFDAFANSLTLGVFTAFRDRQIVNSMLSDKGKYRVLKSRNIISNGTVNVEGYDAYIDDLDGLNVAKYLNGENVVLVPNLTYAPRACFLPSDTITNGSVALLTLKDDTYKITEKDLELFATKEFTEYYRIARNYGTRSLNIDNNSVFFFGIRR